jgi:thiol-disulfide isomerase/thioredoxin
MLMDKQTATGSFKKLITWRNALNALFFTAMLLLLFNPTAKGLVVQGLMKAGLFKPDVKTAFKPVPISSNVSFKDGEGNMVSLASLKGKVVFINFWATWCPPCRAEMPSINNLNKKLNGDKNVTILMVDIDGNLNKSIAFIKKHNYDLQVYQALNNIPSDLLGQAIPATVIINKRGQLVFKHNGMANYDNDEILNYLKKLAAE